MTNKILYSFIPKALFIVLILFVFSYFQKISYLSTSLIKVIPNESLGSYRGDPLLKGDKVVFDYVSRHPNLGTIGIKFSTFYRINTDILRFKIKRVDQDGWYYEHDYKSDQFQSGMAFPFGFPIIGDSSGKIYRIEIESLFGTKDDSVAISSPSDNPVIAKHVFTRNEFFDNPKIFLYVIYNKVIFLITDRNFLSYLFVHALPLLFYGIYSFFGFTMGAFSLVIFASILSDIFFIKGYSSFFTVSVLFGWGLMIYRHKIENMVSSSVSIFMLLMSTCFYLFAQPVLADKFAIWAYLFLSFSTIQSVLQINTDKSKLLRLKGYWINLVIEAKNEVAFLYLVVSGEISITAKRVWLDVTGKGSEVKDKGSLEAISLVVYRSSEPMVRTYIYVTRVISYAIIVLVWSIGYSIRYGHFFLFGWLVWLNFQQVRGYQNFFNEYFVKNQDNIFWTQVGKNMLIIYIVVFVISSLVLLDKRLGFRKKTLCGVIFLYISLFLCRTVFNFATPYRDEVKVWSVSPDDVSEPWADIVISGRNLGEMPFFGKVYINGIEQRVTEWSNNKIIFRTNPSTTKSGLLEVRSYNKKVSNTTPFVYTGNR